MGLEACFCTSFKIYRVEYKPDLTQPEWNPLPGDVTAPTNSADKVDMIDSTGRRFYRIVVVR